MPAHVIMRAMNFKQLQAFVTVAEQGSFSKAAERLGTLQPALSRQVRGLEVQLREHLFERHGRGVKLTAAGERLLGHGRAILQMLEEAQADFGNNAQEPAGHIAIGLPPSWARRLSIPLIHHFQQHLPRVRLEIVEGFSGHMLNWLDSGRVDLCFIYNPEPQPSLQITALRKERLCLVGPQDSLPPHPIDFGALPAYPLIIAQRGQIFRTLMEAQAFAAGVQLDIAWEVSSVPVILDLLQAGQGYAVLAESALSSHRLGPGTPLGARAIQNPEIHCPLCLAQRSQPKEPALIRSAKQALVTVLQQG